MAWGWEFYKRFVWNFSKIRLSVGLKTLWGGPLSTALNWTWKIRYFATKEARLPLLFGERLLSDDNQHKYQTNVCSAICKITKISPRVSIQMSSVLSDLVSSLCVWRESTLAMEYSNLSRKSHLVLDMMRQSLRKSCDNHSECNCKLFRLIFNKKKSTKNTQ